MSKLPVTIAPILGLVFATTFVSRTYAGSLGEFDSGTEGWTFSQLSPNGVAGGYLFGDKISSNGDPKFIRNVFPLVETTANGYIHLRLSNDSTLASDVNVFWDDNGGFNGTDRVIFTSTNDGSFYDYVLDLTGNADWSNGRVGSMRIDPAAGTGAGQSRLDYVRISNSATNSYSFGVDDFADGNSGAWNFSGNTTGVSESGGVFSGSAASNNGDAWMSRDIINVDGSEANLVRIRMAVTGSSIAELFWANEDGNFSAARRQDFATFNDGAFHVYEIDLSSDVDWNGKTIDAFRLDPVTAANASFQIDYIEIVPEPSSLALLGMGGLLMLKRRRH